MRLPATGLLGDLKPATRDALADRILLRKFKAGMDIIALEEQKSTVYVVLEGDALATLVSEEGKLVAYRAINAGDIFGEMAALTGHKRSASVRAKTDIVVGVLSENVFARLCEDHPDFVFAIARQLACQVEALTKRVFEQTTLEVRQRVARELVRIVQASGKDPEGSADLFPAPTHSNLAAQIGCEREAVTKALSQLNDSGLIEKNRRNIRIPSVEALLTESEF